MKGIIEKKNLDFRRILHLKTKFHLVSYYVDQSHILVKGTKNMWMGLMLTVRHSKEREC